MDTLLLLSWQPFRQPIAPQNELVCAVPARRRAQLKKPPPPARFYPAFVRHWPLLALLVAVSPALEEPERPPPDLHLKLNSEKNIETIFSVDIQGVLTDLSVRLSSEDRTARTAANQGLPGRPSPC